jgi:hypothetical protein
MNSEITKIPPRVKKIQLFKVGVFRYFYFLIHSTIKHVPLYLKNLIH